MKINTSKKLIRINEDIDDFEVGDEKYIDGKHHKITDIDPETKSVSWSINKTLDDSDIYKELTKLINLLEKNKKLYYDHKRIAKLLQKLKFIRNTFKRTSI